MSTAPARESLYLIDAHALIFQVFHAIREPMSSPSGLPTNALFGFTRDLLFLRQRQPTYLVCAFDRADPTFRSDIYPEYKAHRAPMPNDLEVQIPLMHQVLDALAIPVLSVAGFEADDILATVGKAAAERGLEVFLCTSDKDCRQLIGDHVQMFNLRKRMVFGKAELLEDWGIAPEQVVDLQTLVGDSVDNVPGVPGIGVKTAAKLLQEFGTLEKLLDNIDKVSGAKKQESLKAALPTLERTRRLVRLDTGVPLKMEWEAWRLRPADNDRLLKLFQEFGFHTLASQVRTAVVARSGDRATTGASSDLATPVPPSPGRATQTQQRQLVQEELFPFGANILVSEETVADSSTPSPNGVTGKVGSPEGIKASSADWRPVFHLIDSADKFEAFRDQLGRQQRFAIDTETTSLSPLEAKVVGLSFSWQADEAWYLALRGPEGSAVLDPQATLASLKPILEDPAVAKVNQNIKYDLLVLRGQGIHTAGVASDSMVSDYLLHAGERSHNLEELARRYLNHQVIPITDLIGKKSRKQLQLRMDQVDTKRVAVYSGEDAVVAWRLCGLLEDKLRAAPPLPRLYQELEVPLIEVLAELEYNGIRLDVPLLDRLSQEMEKQLREIENDIYTLAGHRFQIGSLPQLRTVLFEELKLPSQRKTGITRAASTDQESLEKLAALDHPGSRLPRKILEQRQIAKLKSTYVDALPTMVNPRTGRVHASFNQTVAATGRLSASDPNLQNIPVRREQGQQIRQAFLPAEGWVLLTADYSQIELRLLAHFSGDEAMCQAFAQDRDIHTAVASQIFHVDEKAVSSAQRRVAKTVNFGVIYGMSAPGLAQRLGIRRDAAERFIESYFARYPRVLDYQTRLLQNCRRTGFVGTILGRRRAFDAQGIRAQSSYRQRNQAEREAINMEVQGSAADLIKLAMLNLFRRLRSEKWQARMLLQIHDELVFEAPPAELGRLAAVVRAEMTTPLEKALELKVPLRVDLAAGPNWLDVTEIGV